jgi:tripeptide aminopeptidase
MDGGTRGLVEDETFSANSVDIIIRGVITHPGQAKNKMESAIKIAADIISALPKDTLSPETTEKREGFIHPVSIKGGAEKASIHLILRDFEDHGISDKVEYLKEICERVIKDYKYSSYDFLIKESYRNMKRVLDKYPRVMEYSFEAVRRSGMEPWTKVVRGGTDGSRLSFMGLPCPNIFSGGHAIHSPKEWVSVQDMQKAVETIVNLVQIWEEKS